MGSRVFEFLDKVNRAISSTHLTGDVFTMCFILTMNYIMKISLQQQKSFVIRVGLSL